MEAKGIIGKGLPKAGIANCVLFNDEDDEDDGE